MSYDGTSAESVRYGFKTDFGNVRNQISPTPPAFPSLGALGCAADTLACGPDNEDGRGLFTAFTIGGKEWLLAAGSRQTNVLRHLYLTTDTTITPQFPFVGLSLPGGTRGTTAAAALGSSLYVGFSDSRGAGTPYMLRLSGLPADSSQPLNPTLAGVPLPNTFNSSRTGLIDAMLAYGGSLYAANDGGCARYPGSAPWVQCTPSNGAWTAKAPVATSKASNFIPADKAVPQMTLSGNRFYLARNTTSGPQLWMCNPSSNACDTGNWTLVAANQSGDAQLTQMNDPALTAISLLVGTTQHLYVGFDSPSGLRVFRSADPTPTQAGDFNSVGAVGLGASLTQILDGQALTVGGREFLYLSARPASGPLRLYRMSR
jgi:hypothetical protein